MNLVTESMKGNERTETEDETRTAMKVVRTAAETEARGGSGKTETDEEMMTATTVVLTVAETEV